MATVENLDIQISVSVNQAATAIQRLGRQLNSLTRGLGINATGLSRLTSVSAHVTTGFNKLSGELKQTAKRFIGIGASIKGVQTAVKNSMNYIETLNYFNAAFEQVAENADLSLFSKMGYASAEEYFNSFSGRAKELTSKMSGFNINIDGTLTASGLPSLGIDPNKLMNFQAMFGQMSSSIGVASETSLKLSNALSMIGADLASVKNMNFDKVWEDMASGLAGMSRTLDKYGVNIRNVNLQQKLNELGIQANISALNQNEKALLRGIILLDSTRYAWGDLAETLNQPANQLRLIQGNLQNLSRTIGNLFLPIVAKVLPYINAFVIALQRLFTWIARIFKIDISNLLPKGGGGSSGISDLIGDTEELEDNLNKATSAAKKLNKQVRAFDELNVISTSNGGAGETSDGGIGSGLLDAAFDEAYQEYLDAWNDAFNGIEDRAQEIADKIQEFFQNLFKPIATAWNEEGSFVIRGWKNAFEEIGKLVKDIGRDFITMWQQQETVDIFKDIFHIIGDIGFVVGNLTDNFRTAWNENNVGLHIFENIRDIIGAIVKNIRKAADYTVQWSKTLDFYPILSSIGKWTESLIPMYDALSGMAVDFYTQALLPLGKWTLEKGLPDLLDVAIKLNKSINWTKIRKSLQGLNTEIVKIGKFTFTGVVDFIDKFLSPIAAWTMNEALPTLVDTVTDLSEKIKWAELNENLRKFWEGLSRFVAGIGDGLILFFKSVSPFLTSALAAVINGIGTALGFLGDVLNKIPIEVAQMLGGAIGGVLTVFAAYEGISGVISGISTALQGLSSAFALLAANPLVATAAAIGAVAGALISLQESWENQRNQLWETEQIQRYGDTLDNIKNKYQELGDKIVENSQMRIDHVNSVSAVEVGYLDTIAEKYFTLSEKTDLSAKEYGELKLAADKLVENFPQLQQYYDETTGLINTEKDTILDLIDAKKQELTLNAISEEWTAAIKDQLDAQKALDETTQNLTNAQGELRTAYQNLKDAQQGDRFTDEAQEKYAKASEAVTGFAEAQKAAKEALDEVNSEISYYEGVYSSTMEKLQTNAGDYGKTVANNYTETLTTEIESAKPEVQTAIDGLLDKENITVDTTPIGVNAVDGIVTTIEESDLTTPIETKMNEMSDAATDALGGVPSTVFSELGEGAITGLTDAIDSNFNNPISKLQELAEKMKAAFDNIKSDFYDIGTNVMQGLLDGLKSMESSLYAKAQSIADNIAKTIQKALDIHSPSRVMFKLGDFTMQGFQDGLESLYKPIESSLKGFSVNLQTAPTLEVGNYQFAQPPKLDDMYNYKQASKFISEYNNTGTNGSAGLSEQQIYNIFYNATKTAIENSSLLREQKDMLGKIYTKPTMEINTLNKELAKDSWIRSGNGAVGGMRLAVAQEII